MWFQFDESDSDLPTFFFYLGRALELLPDGSSGLPVFSPEYLADIWSFARRTFQEMFVQMPNESVLVFDNLNSIKEDSLLLPLLETAISQIPESTTVVFVSRTRPPPIFSRALASQHLCELTWDEIRFTEDESVAFSTLTTGITHKAALGMHKEMSGWIAGMVLTLASRKNGSSPQVVTSEDSMYRIFDYFANEVFVKMPALNRTVLMKTSLLSEITESMANELCEVSGTDGILEPLSRQQFFVDKRLASEPSYRFHDLFRLFLQNQLTKELPRAERNAVCVRAAILLEKGGSYDEAITLYIRAGDFSSAARAVQDGAARLMNQGRWQTVRSHIESLPDVLVSASPWLLYWMGCATMQTELSRATTLHTQSYEGFKKTNDKNGVMLSCACLINQIYFEYDDFTRMGPWMDVLNDLVQDPESQADPETELSALDALLKGAMFCSPRFPNTQEVVLRMEVLLGSEVDVNQRVSAFVSLLTYASLVADFLLGDRLIGRLSDSLSDPRLTPLNRAYWWLFVGYYMHVKGESAQCLLAFDHSDAIAKQFGLRQTEMLSTTFRSYEDQVSGNYNGAKATLDQLKVLLNPLRSMDRAQFHLSSTLFHLMKLEGRDAARHARLAMESANKLGSPFFRDHWKWYCAAGLAANDELDEAEAWMNQCVEHASGTYNERHMSGMLAVLAFISIRRGDLAVASSRIQQMLDTARKNGTETFIRMTLGLKDVVLRSAFRMAVDPSYVRQLILSFGVPADSDSTEDWPWRLRIYTFGAFRILRDDVPLTWSQKTPKKPLTLLKALIAFGGQRVPATKLQDTLWPDQEGDMARSAFDVALHRLRKLIGIPGLIEYVDGVISIDRRYVWTDVWCLLSDADEGSTISRNARTLYCGEFLAEDRDESWSAPLRDRIRRLQRR